MKFLVIFWFKNKFSNYKLFLEYVLLIVVDDLLL